MIIGNIRGKNRYIGKKLGVFSPPDLTDHVIHLQFLSTLSADATRGSTHPLDTESQYSDTVAGPEQD